MSMHLFHVFPESNIQFHWHLDTTNSRFWLVNILLWKFDTLSKKRNENDKNTNFMMKNSKKMSKKYMKALIRLGLLVRVRLGQNFSETEKIYWCHIVRWAHSNDNSNIITIMTCLDANPFFPEKRWFSKTVKTSYKHSYSLLFLWEYLINQNQNCVFMIRKDWSFYDQNLQFIVILHKRFNIFIFIFSALIFFCSKIFSIVHFARSWLFCDIKLIKFF